MNSCLAAMMSEPSLGAEHRKHEPHRRVGESAQVATHEAGIERVRKVDCRGHARIDQACGAETHTGIGIMPVRRMAARTIPGNWSSAASNFFFVMTGGD